MVLSLSIPTLSSDECILRTKDSDYPHSIPWICNIDEDLHNKFFTFPQDCDNDADGRKGIGFINFLLERTPENEEAIVVKHSSTQAESGKNDFNHSEEKQVWRVRDALRTIFPCDDDVGTDISNKPALYLRAWEYRFGLSHLPGGKVGGELKQSFSDNVNCTGSDLKRRRLVDASIISSETSSTGGNEISNSFDEEASVEDDDDDIWMKDDVLFKINSSSDSTNSEDSDPYPDSDLPFVDEVLCKHILSNKTTSTKKKSEIPAKSNKSSSESRMGPLLRAMMSWIFIGEKSTGSELHKDPIGSSAWMYLLGGEKKWEVRVDRDKMDKKDWDKLVKTLKVPKNLNPNFNSGKNKSSLDENLIIFHATQKPNQILYVPSQSYHSVINVSEEPTVALTRNFVDRFNLKYLRKEVEELLKSYRGENENSTENGTKAAENEYESVAPLMRAVLMGLKQTWGGRKVDDVFLSNTDALVPLVDEETKLWLKNIVDKI